MIRRFARRVLVLLLAVVLVLRVIRADGLAASALGPVSGEPDVATPAQPDAGCSTGQT